MTSEKLKPQSWLADHQIRILEAKEMEEVATALEFLHRQGVPREKRLRIVQEIRALYDQHKQKILSSLQRRGLNESWQRRWPVDVLALRAR